MAQYKITTSSGATHLFDSNAGTATAALDGLPIVAVDNAGFYKLPSGVFVAWTLVESVQSA